MLKIRKAGGAPDVMIAFLRDQPASATEDNRSQATEETKATSNEEAKASENEEFNWNRGMWGRGCRGG